VGYLKLGRRGCGVQRRCRRCACSQRQGLSCCRHRLGARVHLLEPELLFLNGCLGVGMT
jgi:hypothetical protein